MTQSVHIDHYSDVLCVWAYIGHTRTTELQTQFPQQLDWAWHYIPVFGDVPGKFLTQWQNRGGARGYAQHVQEVVAKFNHVVLNEACWHTVQPASSAPAHLWLAAARLAARTGTLPATAEAQFAWAMRIAFFEQAQDIAQHAVLRAIADEQGFDSTALLHHIHEGTAFAALCQDMQKARDANIRISPTYAFNEDRQRLTGNVGYRIIEANVKELLDRPDHQHSWC